MEGAVASLDELIQRLITAGLDPARGGAVARALTPFAASIGKDGVPVVGLGGVDLGGAGNSGYER